MWSTGVDGVLSPNSTVREESSTMLLPCLVPHEKQQQKNPKTSPKTATKSHKTQTQQKQKPKTPQATNRKKKAPTKSNPVIEG